MPDVPQIDEAGLVTDHTGDVMEVGLAINVHVDESLESSRSRSVSGYANECGRLGCDVRIE